jgi:Cof subfamily protein (haloacid dehalogenase superfamily)
MIKFIASDMDGTILLNGAQSVDADTLFTVKRCLDSGIIFAAASGRQTASLRMLFGKLSDQMLTIAENGAMVTYHNEIIHKAVLDHDLAMDIIDDVLKVKNCELLVSGVNTAYISPKTETYKRRMTEVVKYDVNIIRDFHEIKEDIVKIAICDLSGIEHSKDHFMETFGSYAACTVSGDLYCDFMAKGVNKGAAIKKVQERLNLKPEECMAFGDNFNDVEMFKEVAYSFAMEKADPKVKECANHECSKVSDSIKAYLERGIL